MRKISVLLMVLFVGCLAGCSSKVRTVHLTPQAKAADVYIDDKLIQTDLAYKNISCYKDAGTGCLNFKLMPASEKCSALADCQIKVYANQNVTVAAMGTGPSDMACVMYSDDPETDPCNARIRIVQASPDAPTVDVLLRPITKDGTSATNECAADEPEYKNLCFQDASGYETFEPGDYEFIAYISLSKSEALKIPKMTFCPGVNYTIFIIGQTRDNSLSAMSVIDAQMESR